MPRVHVIASRERHKGGDLDFEVDFSTGEVFAAGGVGMSNFLDSLTFFDGFVHFGYQQSYPTAHPLRDPQALAWELLSRGYRVEGPLAAIAPPPITPVPDGALA